MRTEIHPETTQNRFDQLASDGIKEYGNFVRTLENAGVRMARATKFKHAEQFINSVIGVDKLQIHYGYRVFITDKPHELPFPSTIYHVSGGTALESLQKGKRIIPSSAHHSGDVITDRGISLHLIPAFMEALGISIGNLREFVFSGPEINGQQIAQINARIGQSINMVGISSFLKIINGRYFLIDDLAKILTLLDCGKKPNKILVDKFIKEKITVRGSWLDQIREILYGLKPFPEAGDTGIPIYERVRWRLENVVRENEYIGQTVSQPAVALEIDTKKLIESTSIDGLFPILLSGRPIESIFTSLTIVPEAVKSAYVAPEFIKKMSKGDIPIKSLDKIESGKLLGGVSWREAVPKIDPLKNEPLCSIRYSQGKRATWWDTANSGFIAPIKTIEQKAYGVPPMVLASIFGEENFTFTSSESFQRYPTTITDKISGRFGIIEGVFNRWQAI